MRRGGGGEKTSSDVKVASKVIFFLPRTRKQCSLSCIRSKGVDVELNERQIEAILLTIKSISQGREWKVGKTSKNRCSKGNLLRGIGVHVTIYSSCSLLAHQNKVTFVTTKLTNLPNHSSADTNIIPVAARHWLSIEMQRRQEHKQYKSQLKRRPHGAVNLVHSRDKRWNHLTLSRSAAATLKLSTNRPNLSILAEMVS